MTGGTAITLLVLVWLATSALGGASLAFLAKRIHPSLNYRRLWLVYTGLLAFTVAAVMAIAWW
ncbi:MAG: hypothetical protein ACOCVZ_08700 [Gemmatimonadota bacterium]